MITGVTYNDGLVAHFAARHPAIAFTHIHTGQVLTKGGSHIELGWLFAPLAWVLGYFKRAFSLTQDERAKYMLYGLLDSEPARGVFIRGQLGDVVSLHVFTEDEVQFDDATSPTANKAGVLRGMRMKGYGGSDASVAVLIAYTEKALSAIP
ncbi:hypothetical protein B0H14DRAFT_2565871 [Mycena olivaceomarginata]|nr:hypothetical protein B0H14DRAFT_2565871 [Mycena olivaceomarginata]